MTGDQHGKANPCNRPGLCGRQSIGNTCLKTEKEEIKLRSLSLAINIVFVHEDLLYPCAKCIAVLQQHSRHLVAG